LKGFFEELMEGDPEYFKQCFKDLLDEDQKLFKKFFDVSELY